MSDMQQYRIDSHKLHLHPQRVSRWLEGETVAPIYLEVSPSGSCNHRCRFCGMDFMGYKTRFLPTDIFSQRLAELGQLGVRAIMYAGEGEPFLHREMSQLAKNTKAAGIDVAFTTNGVLLRPEVAREVLPVTTWIKVSCNAGTPHTYAHVHGTKHEDFERVMANIAVALRLREDLRSTCTLGFQMLLLPENRQDAVPLAQRVRDLGADYLVIKPYAVHRLSLRTEYRELTYGDCSALAQELSALNTPRFKVIFRHETLRRREHPIHAHHRCLALPFWGYVDASGMLWGCLRHIVEEKFAYGNLCETDAAEVLHGRRRQENMAWCEEHLDIEECHVACRMETVNDYLWELKQPATHVNFI